MYNYPMFNKERDNMNNLKIDIVKKVLMLDTTKELQNVLDVVVNAISRECDQEQEDQKDFAKWKAERGRDEITF